MRPFVKFVFCVRSRLGSGPGQDRREGSSPSYFNPHEVLAVRRYVDDLLNSRQVRISMYSSIILNRAFAYCRSLEAGDIGIIAPYSAQCSKLRYTMTEPKYSEVKIGSVEEFQGQVFASRFPSQRTVF